MTAGLSARWLRVTTVASLAALTAAAGAEDSPTTKPPIDVSGYLQIDYRRGDGGDQSGVPVHEFNVRRARLGVTGKLGERVSYAIAFQGDGLSANSASLIDASVSLRLSSWMRLQAGQFKYDFDLQGRESAARLTFSDRPHVTQLVAGALNGASSPSSPAGSFRDRGVSFVAGPASGRLLASLGLFQGNGRSSDNNSSFAPVLRLQGTPFKGLLVTAGWLYADTASSAADEPGSFRALTVGVAVEKGRMRVRGECYRARKTQGPAARETVEGCYAYATRRIGKDFEASLRYQRLRAVSVLAAGALSSVDVGGRYYIARTGKGGGASLFMGALLRRAGAGDIRGVTLLNDGRGAPLGRGEDVQPVVVARLQVRF